MHFGKSNIFSTMSMKRKNDQLFLIKSKLRFENYFLSSRLLLSCSGTIFSKVLLNTGKRDTRQRVVGYGKCASSSQEEYDLSYFHRCGIDSRSET